MELKTLQKGLLEWLWMEPTSLKKYTSIDVRCQNLYTQFFPSYDTKVAKYQLFEPLLRMGCLEFYGDNQFGLSPTCALTSGNYVLIINLPFSFWMKISEEYPSLIELPGILVMEISDSLLQQLKAMAIPCITFRLLNSLRKFPLPESIIRSWEDSIVIDPSSYFYYKDQWLAANNSESIGVYKKSNKIYAERVCRLNTDTWKAIPNREKHPDAFNLAVTWSKINNDGDIKILYDQKLQLLSIREWQFPMLIERLLIFNTLLQGRDISERNYFLEAAAFRQIDKWLNNKITIKYE